MFDPAMHGRYHSYRSYVECIMAQWLRDLLVRCYITSAGCAGPVQDSIPYLSDIFPNEGGMLLVLYYDPVLHATGHNALLLAGLWSCNVLDSTAFASLHINSECFRDVPLHVRKLFLSRMQQLIDAGQ